MYFERSKNQTLRSIVAFLRLTVLGFPKLILLLWGALCFSKTRRTPDWSYQAMIWMFCESQGKFNDLISRLIGFLNPKVSLVNRSGVLFENFEAKQVESLVQQLRRDGFVLFPQRLPIEICDRLMAFATKTPASVRKMDQEEKSKPNLITTFDFQCPLGVRYDFNPNDLLQQPDVQDLLADGSLLELAQEYLGCIPIADVLSMWWHTNFHDQPDSEAAQFFHFDMDRIKWLKIFIYLTDVGIENGPHSFVRGSHGSGAIPYDILRRGYVRLTDEEIEARYPRTDLFSFTAPRGSIIVEDTRGLHKGLNVKGAPRLILQLQFSNSLFGSNYPEVKLGDTVSPKLSALLKSNPSIFSQYSQSNTPQSIN